MKLNIDCVRDVLIELEAFPMGVYPVSSFKNSISKYGEENVVYSLFKLHEAKYVSVNADCGMTQDGIPHIGAVYDITFQGHEFLSNIKPQSNWQKLSGAFKQIGGASFEAISSAALGLAVDAIKTTLNL